MANQPQAMRRFRLRDIVEDRRIVLMLALGFSSGLPLLLVLGTFTLRLAFSDIDVRAIGLFSYVALPYSLKFLWAPVVDRTDVPLLGRLLGRRRAWMVTTQLVVAACLVLMAFADPATQAFLRDEASVTTAMLDELRRIDHLPRRLRSDLAVSDLYVLMVFYPGDGSLEVRRRWLELIRPGLLGHGG